MSFAATIGKFNRIRIFNFKLDERIEPDFIADELNFIFFDCFDNIINGGSDYRRIFVNVVAVKRDCARVVVVAKKGRDASARRVMPTLNTSAPSVAVIFSPIIFIVSEPASASIKLPQLGVVIEPATSLTIESSPP